MSSVEPAMSEARVATETPSRFLGQLCKHFEHRLPVTLGEREGTIAFEAGRCELRAEDQTLVMRCIATDAERLERVQDVVARHLVRFAFRSPPVVSWAPVA